MSVRRAAVAGQFYPAAPGDLQQDVERYLGEAPVRPRPAQVAALVAPHAGYPYSGPTAGHVFRRVQGMAPGRVVLMGPSHHFRFDGMSVGPSDAVETPLGTVAVDHAFARRLIELFGTTCPEAHIPEHALEVELPFLQTALMPGFTVVPILFGSEIQPFHHALAQHLAAWLEPHDQVVASSDLSHFLTEDEANAIDRNSLDLVISGDCDCLQGAIADKAASMCGATAVYTALAVANTLGATRRTLWDYRTSAHATGDPTRVVGYGAITFEYNEH